MRKIYLYMTTTLDGFIAGPGNELDWMLDTPDKALNHDTVALLRAADAGFLGYPVAQGMIPYWEGVAADPSASPAGRGASRCRQPPASHHDLQRACRAAVAQRRTACCP
jgi:hypothetical protein